jgi:hypothetical protein
MKDIAQCTTLQHLRAISISLNQKLCTFKFCQLFKEKTVGLRQKSATPVVPEGISVVLIHGPPGLEGK